MIIDPLINCLQDIIMHIRCEMQSTYARSMLMGSTKFRERGRNRADELTSFPQTIFYFPATTIDAPDQNILTEFSRPTSDVGYC